MPIEGSTVKIINNTASHSLTIGCKYLVSNVCNYSNGQFYSTFIAIDGGYGSGGSYTVNGQDYIEETVSGSSGSIVSPQIHLDTYDLANEFRNVGQAIRDDNNIHRSEIDNLKWLMQQLIDKDKKPEQSPLYIQKPSKKDEEELFLY